MFVSLYILLIAWIVYLLCKLEEHSKKVIYTKKLVVHVKDYNVAGTLNKPYYITRYLKCPVGLVSSFF